MLEFLIASLVLFFISLIIGIAFLIQGPPYVASDDESCAQIIELVNLYKPKRILDMGSGNGKLVVLLAKEGYRVDGVELDPRLVRRSQKAIKKTGLKNATVKWGNFWSYDAGKYDLIVLYAIKHIMPRLEKKLGRELRPGSYIISNFFVFPNLKPVKRLDRAIVYKI